MPPTFIPSMPLSKPVITFVKYKKNALVMHVYVW
jgi:hypothetical protein